MKDYYQVLGVEKTATQDEIKAAYRNLARQWHPDRHPEAEKPAAEEKFKEIGEANDTLGDPNKRAAYDHKSDDSFINYMNNHFNVWNRRPTDTIGTVEIDLIEAAAGGNRKLTIEHEVPCEACAGTGSATKKKKQCPRCRGTGQLNINHGNGMFMFTQTVICPGCSGQCEIPESICKACGGTAEASKIETLDISIPAGVDTRHVLRLPKMGRHGGDLKIFIVIKRHPKFERIANDLHCTIEIPLKTAIRGGKINTTGLNGEQVELDVPKGCQFGVEVSALGKGICGGALRAKLNFNIPCLPDETADKIASLL